MRQRICRTQRRKTKRIWRVIVVGGHTRSIGKTQLVCDVIRAFPEENWIAGKITQYGHGVCAKNGENCGCAPDEHSYAISWEKNADHRHGQLPLLSRRRQALFLVAHQARLPGRRFALAARGALRSRRAKSCRAANSNPREQFRIAICSAQPLFRSNRRPPRGLQRLRAHRSGSCRCAGSCAALRKNPPRAKLPG